MSKPKWVCATASAFLAVLSLAIGLLMVSVILDALGVPTDTELPRWVRIVLTSIGCAGIPWVFKDTYQWWLRRFLKDERT